MSTSSSVRQLRIPDLFASCPLKPSTNPNYKEAAAESRAWINSYNVFADRKRAEFIQGQNELLCSYAYPFAGHEQFRTTCDFVNLLFVVDEVSDDQTGQDARKTGQVYVKATKYPNWDDGSKLSKITKDFRARFYRLAGPRNAKRWETLCEAYTDCVATEAELREQGRVLPLKEFIPLRRNNSAVVLCFTLNEYNLGIDLEDEVFQDETFLEAYWAAVDHVCWANDIYSYDVEQSKGHTGNNIVTVLMQENNTSLQETADYIGTQCGKFVETYLSAKARLSPSLGPDAARFIDALGFWMVGNITWSFETPRYFGSQRLQVQESGVLYLRPEMLVDDKSESSDEE